MMRYAADTWFLLFLWNKDETAQRIMSDVNGGKARLLIPYAAVAEATKKLMQRGNSAERIESFWSLLEASEKIRFISLEKSVALEGARVSMTYGIPTMDALIAASAKLSGCNMLISGDADMAKLARKKYLAVKSW